MILCPQTSFGSSILSFAKRIIQKTGLKDDSYPARDVVGQVIQMDYSPSYLCEKINETKDYKNWAILVRTNADINAIGRDLTKAKIPYLTFKQGDLNREKLNEKMNTNAVKVLTIHSSKGLGFKNVAVYGMVWWKDEEYRLNYVAATRAKDLLIWFAKPKKKTWC